MSLRRFAEIGVAAPLFYILTTVPAAAAVACCEYAKNPCCDTPNMTCCETANDPAPVAVLIPQGPEPKVPAAISPERPNRETLTVWFMRPVKVGDRILLGKYVIEHDNVRMAHGWPCTYIYAADDRQLPVVAFRCKHLNRPPGERASVILRPLGEANGMQDFREFQFAGETGAHGLPTGR